MPGHIIPEARKAFSESLKETLYGKELDAIRPFKCLDEGVAGYAFDLAPLHKSLASSSSSSRAFRFLPVALAFAFEVDRVWLLPFTEASASGFLSFSLASSYLSPRMERRCLHVRALTGTRA